MTGQAIGESIVLNVVAGEVYRIANFVRERMTYIQGSNEIEYKDRESGKWRLMPAGSRVNGQRTDVDIRSPVDGRIVIELETDIELAGSVTNEIVLSGGTIDLLRQIQDVSATVQGKIEAAVAAAMQSAATQSAMADAMQAGIAAAQPIQTTV